METTTLGLYIPISPFLGTLNIRCRIIIGIQKGATILTTTHLRFPKIGGYHLRGPHMSPYSGFNFFYFFGGGVGGGVYC